MFDMDKVIEGLEHCMSADTTCTGCPYEGTTCSTTLSADALAMLQEEKPLRCDKCGYHREDGWCDMHGRWVKETDYCSFGAWKGR